MKTLFISVFLISLMIVPKSEPAIYVYFKNDRLLDFYLIFNEGEFKSFSQLQRASDPYIDIKVIRQEGLIYEFKHVPRLDFLACKSVGFIIRDASVFCTLVIRSEEGVLRVIGKRETDINSCSQTNDVILEY